MKIPKSCDDAVNVMPIIMIVVIFISIFSHPQ